MHTTEEKIILIMEMIKSDLQMIEVKPQATFIFRRNQNNIL